MTTQKNKPKTTDLEKVEKLKDRTEKVAPPTPRDSGEVDRSEHPDENYKSND